ncbi:hypothetical protein UPYG_G00174960 [Umbra pygmaea]|uniref:Secreted protein n=1 Tax=Umbra pygmaea TaxID=75934 RepID=A0ABD0WPK5_UMBPY
MPLCFLLLRSWLCSSICSMVRPPCCLPPLWLHLARADSLSVDPPNPASHPTAHSNTETRTEGYVYYVHPHRRDL